MHNRTVCPPHSSGFFPIFSKNQETLSRLSRLLSLLREAARRSGKLKRLSGGILIATIKDIARLTGVSIATVSNVLNGKTGAAGPAKANEILKAAASLNYQPNTLAKNLKLRRSRTVGIITEDLTVFNTPEIVDGIESFCEEQGYEIVLANMRLFKRYDNDLTDTPEHASLFRRMLRNLAAKQVEGIVYIGYHYRRIPHLPPPGSVPFIYAYCTPSDNQYSSVAFDDESASFQVGVTLIQQGHRKIGVISGPMESLNAQARLRGFQRALYQSGVLYNADFTVYGDWSQESGLLCARELIKQGVTAIYAFNDLMACGVYLCCASLGLTVGRDLSVFGYDNQNICLALSPPLSSVEVPLGEMGRRCAALVLEQINKSAAESPRECAIPCLLHLRASVAPPPEKAAAPGPEN